MKESRNGYLLKNTVVFTIGNIGSKLITFFLIPLYTNLLTTSQYGIIDLVTTIGTVAVPIVTLNICESVMRFNLDKNSNQKKIIQIGNFIFILALFGGLLIIPMCKMYSEISEYSIYIFFYVITLSASQLYLCNLRGKELLIQYSIGNITLTFLVAIFNLFFLGICEYGIRGYLLAYINANAIVAIYALIVGKAYEAFGIKNMDFEKMIDMVKYSIVLIPNSFMWWIINASDRIMVTAMIGADANGIYAISYKVPMLISTLTGIFNQAWGYSAIREAGAGDESEYNNKVFKTLISFVMLLGIGLLVIIKPFLRFYVSDLYFDAWKYTTFLTIGCVYLTLGTFMATSYTVHKDSLGYLLSASFGAFFNIIFNFMFIPIIGVYGASIATCISYVVVFAFRILHTRKYLKYDICNKEFILGSIFLVISARLVFLDNMVALGIQVIMLVSYVGICSKEWLGLTCKLIRK